MDTHTLKIRIRLKAYDHKLLDQSRGGDSGYGLANWRGRSWVQHRYPQEFISIRLTDLRISTRNLESNSK